MIPKEDADMIDLRWRIEILNTVMAPVNSTGRVRENKLTASVVW